MDRRQMLTVAGATLIAGAATGSKVLAAPGTAAELNTLFDAFVYEGLELQPEGATSLGLDNGPRAGLKAKLADRSPAGAKAQQALNANQLSRLEAFDAGALSPADALNRDIVLRGMRETDSDARRFKYASGNAGAPYVINQFQGSAFHDLPDFLDAQHLIATRDDAEAYLARLAAFATAIDQDGESARLDQSLGVVPPDFVLDNALVQLGGLAATPSDKASLVQSLVRRTKDEISTLRPAKRL